MSDLSRDARDLLAQAKKDGLGPSAADRARIRHRLTPLWAANAPAPRPRRGWPVRLVSVVVIAGLGALSWMFMHTAAPHSSPETGPQLVAAAIAAAPVVAVGSQTDTVPHPLQEDAETQAIAAPRERSRQPPSKRSGGGARVVETPQALSPTAGGPDARGAHDAAPGDKGHSADDAAAGDTRRGDKSHSADDAAAGDTRRGDNAAPGDKGHSADNAAAGDTRRGASAAPGDKGHSADDAAAGAKGQRAHAVAARQAPQPIAATGDRAGAPDRARVSRAVAATDAHSSTVRSDAQPSPPSIDGELELLSAAQSALQQQRPSRALSLLQEHAFRFPTGALSEERMAMQALALCASGRKHAAQTVLSNLEARGAPSQLLPRVRSQCGL